MEVTVRTLWLNSGASVPWGFSGVPAGRWGGGNWGRSVGRSPGAPGSPIGGAAPPAAPARWGWPRRWPRPQARGRAWPGPARRRPSPQARPRDLKLPHTPR